MTSKLCGYTNFQHVIVTIHPLQPEIWLITTLFRQLLNLLWQWEHLVFNTFPSDKILDVTESKAFADDTLNIVKMMISFYDRVENTVGKGEHTGNQHFLLFPQCFPKPSSFWKNEKMLCNCFLNASFFRSKNKICFVKGTNKFNHILMYMDFHMFRNN